MLESRLARGLLLLGAAVGVMTVGVWALDIHVNPPDWMIRVAMIKLAVLASGGLLSAGALLGRHAKARASVVQELPVPLLGEGSLQPLEQRPGGDSELPIERDRTDTP